MISIRCSSEDENLIKKFAAIKKQSVSEFLRQAALEKIEDEYDLKLVKDYLEKKEKMSFYSADEVEKELGI
ncbi:MAG: ribbon-helix-helix protein, CopG family [Acetoanaerobium sp.]|nr:ribbon-helix-helix protein, CopG family [Acetoanaerobium sp.]